uniref:Uncharacterized protein n=1 Tax=Salmo trutta TaxID=8032 RepID=A0A673XJ63_SALTR
LFCWRCKAQKGTYFTFCFHEFLRYSLLEDHYFLYELLDIIGRLDLLRLLETVAGSRSEWTTLRLMQREMILYRVSEDVTQENVTKIKFLLSDKLLRGRLDLFTVRSISHTPTSMRTHTQIPYLPLFFSLPSALEVLCEMERQGLLTEDRLEEFQRPLEQFDTQLAHTVRQHRGNADRHSSSVLCSSSSLFCQKLTCGNLEVSR